MFAKVVFVVACLVVAVSAQESVNAQEGFEVGKQVGIALAICYSILATFAISVNCIKKRCVKAGSY
jgi:hypothetical protein